MAFEAGGQLYARECSANTLYADGAIRLRQGRRDEAAAAFREALKRVPGHPLAAAALARVPSGSSTSAVRGDAMGVDPAIVQAAVLALAGKHDQAARLCGDALARAEPGPAGWLLPVEPLLNATAHRDVWADTLAMVRDRAI